MEEQIGIACKECLSDRWIKIPGYETLYECGECGYPENMNDESKEPETNG